MLLLGILVPICLFAGCHGAATGPTASVIPAESPIKASLNPRPGACGSWSQLLLQDSPLMKAGSLEVVTGS